MNLPLDLLIATWLLWGWQIGQAWLGALCAVLCALAAMPGWRWPARLQRPDAPRLATRIGLGVAAIIVLMSVLRLPAIGVSLAVLQTFIWLPLALLPQLLLPPSLPGHRWLAWGMPLLAASAVPGGASAWFFPALCVLLARALWCCRAGQGLRAGWVASLLLAAAIGHAGHLGLYRLHGAVEAHFGEWFMGMESGADADPFRSQTALGRLGELKLSERIVMRVRSRAPLDQPLLLRDAVYVSYLGPDWVALRNSFAPLPADAGGWPLQALTPGATPATLDIHLSLRRNQGLLALPPGSTRIDGISRGQLSHNPAGVVRISNAPDVLHYRVQYSTQADAASPGVSELHLPRHLQGALSTYLASNGLAADNPATTATRLHAHFATQFRYSLIQRGGAWGADPLLHFLQQSRAGHCEFFATASVLLLRSAGIPARYVTGYSVQEYSPREQAYVVRARHAHAWAQMYVDGRWQDFDATPANWAEMEAPHTPLLQPLYDFANWLWFVWQRWQPPGLPGGWLAGAALLLSGGLVFRLLQQPVLRRWRAWRTRQPARGKPDPWQGFEQYMARQGLQRRAAETGQAWLARILPQLDPPRQAMLDAAMQLHYRAAYSAQGLNDAEQARLTQLLRALEEEMRRL